MFIANLAETPDPEAARPMSAHVMNEIAGVKADACAMDAKFAGTGDAFEVTPAVHGTRKTA